jgi:hypothetical protein
MKVFDPKTLVGWYQLREQTKNSEKSDVRRRMSMAIVAGTGHAQSTVRVRTVESQSVVNDHSKTCTVLFMVLIPHHTTARTTFRVSFPRISRGSYIWTDYATLSTSPRVPLERYSASLNGCFSGVSIESRRRHLPRQCSNVSLFCQSISRLLVSLRTHFSPSLVSPRISFISTSRSKSVPKILARRCEPA